MHEAIPPLLHTSSWLGVELRTGTTLQEVITSPVCKASALIMHNVSLLLNF
jgi:hypothetical protein